VRTKSFQETLATTKSDFRTELDLMHVEARTTKIEALLDVSQEAAEAYPESMEVESKRSKRRSLRNRPQ
jgi:hypothetical protein